MKEYLKTGDLVKLKSPGAGDVALGMVVFCDLKENDVKIVWFDGSRTHTLLHFASIWRREYLEFAAGLA